MTAHDDAGASRGNSASQGSPETGALNSGAARAHALSTAIRKLGLTLNVQPDGALAVLIPATSADALALNDAVMRERVISAAREAGFTHAAVELLPPSGDVATEARQLRLFIAIEVPGDIQQGIQRTIARELHPRLPDARWVRAENMHITLKFLGDTEPHRVDGVKRELCNAVAQLAPFQLNLGTVGGFPVLSRPRVVWLGVKGSGQAECESLAGMVEQACSSLGFSRETRRFSAHLTLARMKPGRGDSYDRPKPEFTEAARQFAHQWSVPVTHVSLMHSELSRGGSRYTTLSRCALGVDVEADENGANAAE